MDVVDSIEEALQNLDIIFDKEGIKPIDAYRLKVLLENLTKNEIVLTLENLVTDPTALSEIILKIHYVKELLMTSSESLSSDLIQTMNALQHVSTNSLKYLTPGLNPHHRQTFPHYEGNSEVTSSKLESIKQCKEKLIKRSAQIVERESEVKIRIEKLEHEAAHLKEGILQHIKSHTTIPMPNLSPHSAPKSLTQRTFFNKTAESRISQLDFDAALTALSSEVNKLEKKLVYQRSEEDELKVSTLLNELLMTQIECAEECRLNNERYQSELRELSSKRYNEYRQNQLHAAIERSSILSKTIDLSYESTQEEFEIRFNEIRERFDEMLEIENNKNIAMVRNHSSTLSKNLDHCSRQLSQEYTLRSNLIHRSIDEIVDKLHDQVKSDTKNFSRVYDTATTMLQENREKNALLFKQQHQLDDNELSETSSQLSLAGCKPSIQTTIYDAFTDIHELQVIGNDPIENFTKVFNEILEEQDTECQEFLKRADETLNKYRQKILNRHHDHDLH